MQAQTRHRHMIDFLFPVTLFFLFAICALTIILLAADVYRSSVSNSARNDTARTCLSYVSEKLHQNDAGACVSLGAFDGCEALILKEEHGEDTYYTYIYFHNGELKELFMKEGTQAEASSGQTILTIKEFSIEQLSDQLFRFQCTDVEGRTASAVTSLKSSGL